MPLIRLPRGADVDVVDSVRRNHVAPEHHRLQVQPAVIRKHARDLAEEVAVDVVLPSGSKLLGGAEVLEGAEAGHGVELAEGIAADPPRVFDVHVETVAPAGRRLSR